MTAAARTPIEGPQALPRLRADLGVELIQSADGGFPAVVITDPVRGSYFRLAWPECAILLAWRDAASAVQVSEAASRTWGLVVSPEEIGQLVEFAAANQLTEVDVSGGWQRFAEQHTRRKRSLASTLLHNYLFFRVPLLRPDAWLGARLPWFGFAFTRWFWTVLAAAGFAGLYLAARQWSAVLTVAGEVLQLESLAVYAAALLALKALHELGHAVTTVRYGCRVPSMGIAVMLGAPVFYTDTSDSWRLAQKRQRLAIVFAGVAAEMIVAVVALLLWCFLPDGLPRKICFAVATGAVVLSLVVNLNPCMRFDGYFALSDYLDVPNLQSRAFALGTWRLREIMFDLGHPPPEQLPPRLRRTLIRYAVVTAIYRLFLFLGIAAAVYAIAGKAVGLLLGGIEIGVFIVRPIVQEIAAWWKLRAQIVRRRRLGWTSAIMAAAVAVFVVPWISTVEVPAVLTAEHEEPLHLPFAARLTSIEVREGQRVHKGDRLFTADAADLHRDHERSRLEAEQLAIQVGRLVVSDKEREQRVVIVSKLARTQEKLDGIERRFAQLAMHAPFDGRIVDIDPEISPGLWLNEKRQLGRVVAEHRTRARGLVAATDVARIAPGAKAVFLPDDAQRPRQPLTVAAVAQASDRRLTEPALADRFGGPVLAGETKGQLVARNAYFDVEFELVEQPVAQIVRGIVRVEATAVSPLNLLWRAVARVLVREQAF